MARPGNHPIPLSGALLAAITFTGMLASGVNFFLSAAVLLVWIGSLVLVSARPPAPPPAKSGNGFSRTGMRELIEHSATPLLMTEENKVVIANGAARRVLGGHIVGQDTRMAFRQPEIVALLAANRSGSAVVRGISGRKAIWQINLHALDDSSAVLEMINQTAEADISRAHSDFVANASHELRTPLASIIGYVETLRESGVSLDQETSNKFLDTILRESRRLQSLVDDLMSLSRVEAEKHDLPTKSVDLRRLVERAARDAAGAERLPRLNLAVDIETQVHGDEQQLEQLVRNLVDNALKYGSADEAVTVSLGRTRDGQAKLSFMDRGDGIDPEHIPHLTRRFYRTDPGRSRASGGTGLGLAIVKHIVERHRGRLDISSKLGKGTEVIVRIPTLTEEAEPKS